MPRRILIVNGPNLNMLGFRQPEIYGTETLEDIETLCHAAARPLDMAITFRQTDCEGELVTWIQDARASFDGIVINAAAFTHTSVALLDALNAFDGPIVEVHLSNIQAREAFRRRSYISQIAEGVICGFGSDGYRIGLMALDRLTSRGTAA